MTIPDDHSTPTDTHTSATGAPSLSRLLETWQAWSGREMFARAEARARAAGDDEQAARLRDMLARDCDVAALDALRAQHEMSSLLVGWEWHTVRAAREQGATWADIAHATRTDPEHARTAYVEQVDRQEQAAARGGMPFDDDTDDYRAAAGEWVQELHPETPDHVIEQIGDALVRDDVDELAALRSAWWNPAHVPAVAVFEAPTEIDAQREDCAANPWASLPGADQVPHTHTAVGNRRLLGVAIDATDAEIDAAEAAQDAADRAFQADIEAEVAEADALYGPDPYGHLGQVRAPGPAQFDDPWRTQGPPAPGIDLSVEVSGNDLAGDVERVLAHLRVQNIHHDSAAEPLWDMPVERWEASLAVLRAGGYEIATSTATHGDTAANGPAYWLATDPSRDRPATSTTDQPAGPGWWAKARSTDADVAPVVFDGSGFYSNVEIAAIGDALAAGDTERAEALQDRPWLAQGVTVDTAHVRLDDDRPAHGDEPVMPELLGVQARRNEAELAAGTYVPGPIDDPARIAARLADLREQAAAGDPGASTVREGDQSPHMVRSCLVEIDDEQQEARREQLTRWHADDTDDTAVDGDHDGDGAVDGPGDRFILVDGTEQP